MNRISFPFTTRYREQSYYVWCTAEPNEPEPAIGDQGGWRVTGYSDRGLKYDRARFLEQFGVVALDFADQAAADFASGALEAARIEGSERA